MQTMQKGERGHTALYRKKMYPVSPIGWVGEIWWERPPHVLYGAWGVSRGFFGMTKTQVKKEGFAKPPTTPKNEIVLYPSLTIF